MASYHYTTYCSLSQDVSQVLLSGLNTVGRIQGRPAPLPRPIRERCLGASDFVVTNAPVFLIGNTSMRVITLDKLRCPSNSVGEHGASPHCAGQGAHRNTDWDDAHAAAWLAVLLRRATGRGSDPSSCRWAAARPCMRRSGRPRECHRLRWRAESAAALHDWACA